MSFISGGAQFGQPSRGAGLLFGLRVDAICMAEALERCRQALKTRRTLLVGVLNAAKIVSLQKNGELRNAILDCNMLLADGQAVVWASRVLGHKLPERVAGIDLFQELLGLADRDQRRIYLLGATPHVLDSLLVEISRRWPGAEIVGSQDGYYTEDQAEAVAERIRNARPDMLFLGMPSPKKEIFLRHFQDHLGVPILHGVGGSFDVLAGLTRRAPVLWQRMGLEWAYRLLQEPRRLWKRYLTTNTAFVTLTLREVFRPSAELQRMPTSDRTGPSGQPLSP
ncbi:MAG: WecB/TagA/CpsF family glycosyltransferase [Devosia sp.]|uniref:WecB/TagA/CpsF family glycosyltransferase n=1 Tax=Devosia sp. TaxID=1871048 RepID=UPI0019E7B39F|nr:WecB/TagA/CpsF family glycosyltransferase [Devosia sp.]MBF0677748.1 WecB/TagA/CpsF family glycosyltransferase [Devosia sp.]